MRTTAPHRFSTYSQAQDSYKQMDSPSSGLDPRYSHVKNGININHGWKIHADFVTDLSYEEGLAKMGRASDLSIVDQNLADAFDKRLSNLGVGFDDFNKFYKTAFGNSSSVFADPNDIISAAEVFDRHDMHYKMGPGKYGEGRHATAYPQNIVDRDIIIKDLEDTLGNRLVDQNDPSYRAGLGETGVKNHPLSRGVSGRFTTDYLEADPQTGKVDFARETGNAGAGVPDEYKVSGVINDEQLGRIDKVTSEMPEMAELLHGPQNYNSPYKTIEQILEERKTGVIPPTKVHNMKLLGTLSPDATLGSSPTATQAPPAPVQAAASVDPAAPVAPVNAPDPADIGAPVQPKPAPASIPGNVVDDLTLNAPSANQTAGVKAAQAAAANASANPAPPPPQPGAKITTTPASPAASAINRASRASSGAPLGGRTSQIMSHAKNAAEWVTTGKRGVAGLKIAGAGMLLGIGAQKVMGNRQPMSEEDIMRLEMQRRGM